MAPHDPIVSGYKGDSTELPGHNFSPKNKGVNEGGKQEIKEILEKLPELEENNFRIDSTNRKEITDPNGVKLKENPEGDAWELVEGEHKWEQLFTGDRVDGHWKVIKEGSANRETKKAGKMLPTSYTTYRDILEKKYEWNLEDFKVKEKIVCVGWYGLDKAFKHSAGVIDLRCADGSTFQGFKSKWHHSTWRTSDYGYAVRCIKD